MSKHESEIFIVVFLSSSAQMDTIVNTVNYWGRDPGSLLHLTGIFRVTFKTARHITHIEGPPSI